VGVVRRIFQGSRSYGIRRPLKYLELELELELGERLHASVRMKLSTVYRPEGGNQIREI